MFILDSFLGWVLRTVTTAAEAEMNDDTALREQLLEAEMRREMGEIGDAECAEIEADLLARIREIKQRREGGAGPVSMGAEPIEASPDSRFQIEASVSGDFHDPAQAPHTTVIEFEPNYAEEIEVMDIEPGQAEAAPDAALPLSPPRQAARKTPARRKLRKS
ncbi:MAG: gas vesicle protein GvpG [Acidobacteria bacterium]|nr:gas vesicle protein GvpG [Acidobacteriota bacterium]